MHEIDIRRVTFLNEETPQASTERIDRARATNGVSREALVTLMDLTLFAHKVTTKLPDLNEHHLDELQKLKLIFRVPGGVEIQLV
jgi:hypothetical protein